ncbi:hypothetical protein VUJ46_01670 [Chryseobacterium sp. MYb264]|uniref:hypothetical protein n=1 Tax=Chryseobacterium sp. MYb264 TaxID=2745153 RepID=UPI002E120E6D|nr:hypothetical protein VUJ46_01670 [Chryseobacterium sp. MYb264]
MKHKLAISLFISLLFLSCSRERKLKNEIHIYQPSNISSVKDVSITEISNGHKIKIYKKTEIKERYDSLNKIPYLSLVFKDAKQFQMDKSYELKINNSMYKIEDFRETKKNQGSNIFYTINGEPQEIGGDNIIKIDLE